MKVITITITITLLVSVILIYQGVRAHEHKKDAHSANGTVSISATVGSNTIPELTTASGSHSSTTGANPVIAVAAAASPHVGDNGSVLLNIPRFSDSTTSAPTTDAPKQSSHSGHGGSSHDRPDRHDGTHSHIGHGGLSHRGYGM
jgi:hypothetical protein